MIDGDLNQKSFRRFLPVATI